MDKPDITSIANDSLVLTWAHARNPAYGKQSPITYSVEVKEQWARAWRTLGSNLTETRFHVKDLQPNQSYSFRILAENEFGLSEPSMTATLHRAIQSMYYYIYNFGSMVQRKGLCLLSSLDMKLFTHTTLLLQIGFVFSYCFIMINF